MYTYTYNHIGYTIYKDGKPIRAASVLNKRKRYNEKDAADNKAAAEAGIRYFIAMDKYKATEGQQ